MLLDEVHKQRYIFPDNITNVYHKYISELSQYKEYMWSNLVFEKVSRDDEGYTVVDLRENCKVTYKNKNLTLMECPIFETEHSYDFYKKLVLDAYPDYVFTNKVVFDCGSCCGLDAILFSEEAKHVYCLEPDAKNFENLSLNTKDFQNITIINKALFNHCNEIEFSSENTQGSMILGKSIDIPIEDLKKLRKTDSIVVQCTTLNEMMSQFGAPDIVKIDIEGSEYDLVTNDSMKSVLEHGSILIFEIHQRLGSLSHYDKLVEYIESFGYKVTFYQDQLLGDHISCVK